jgi:hypothetical protein
MIRLDSIWFETAEELIEYQKGMGYKVEEHKAPAEPVQVMRKKKDVQYMGKRKPNRYIQFLKDRVKKIMIEQKLDYFAASRIAQAEYSRMKTPQAPAQKPYVPMPMVAPQNNGLLRQIVSDLLKKHIDKINIEYADKIGVDEKEWDRFLIKFLQQSKNVAAHFDVPNKFKLEEGSIRYG